MISMSGAEPIVVPGPSVLPEGYVHKAPSEQEFIRRLSAITSGIINGKPVGETVVEILAAISELFGLTGMIFEARDPVIRPVLSWVVYGYTRENADAIVKNLSSDLYPQEVHNRLMSDRFSVSRNGYYNSSEEWLKITDENPMSDHPAYYFRPEQVRLPRKSPDEWHEADSYRYVVRGSSGEILGFLDIDYSLDKKLPSKGVLEAIDVMVDLAAIALESEMRSMEGGKSYEGGVQKTELLEDVLKISSSIVSERDLKKLSDMILSSLSTLFGFRQVTLVVYDESDGVFKWVALFGYPDEVVRDTRTRSIPTEVILEDLKENKRVGKSAYFIPSEDLSSRQLAYYANVREVERVDIGAPRSAGEFKRADCLAFALHDSSGRIVGMMYPSDPQDNRIPSKDTIETMEIFTSLAEVAIENARLTQDRETALRLSSQRTEQLSRILDTASGLMYVRNLDQMLDSLLRTLAQLLGIKRLAIAIKNPELGVYKIEAVYGYSQKAAEAIKLITYPIAQVNSIIDFAPAPPGTATVKWRKKIGRSTYYMPGDSQVILPEELPYYPDPELIRLPRKGKGYWHERDWMDTMIFDKDGVPIAYLELLKPRDDRIPDSETIEIIEIFASLAGIAVENARTFQEHIDSRRNAELYTDVLSHDIKNYSQAILGYLELLKTKLKNQDAQPILNKIGEQVMNTSWLASNVRTMSRVTFGDVELKRTDIGSVLQACVKSAIQYYPGRKMVCKTDAEAGRFFAEADDLVWELFINLLTNAVKYDPHETVEIDISVQKVVEGGRRMLLIAVSDHGQGIPDDIKAIVFDRFSKAPQKKGSGMGLHIVKNLAVRYGGRVWVEDRVPGDYMKGTVFKVELPSLD